MKLENIKIKVETDEENQFVLSKHKELNSGIAWLVALSDGDGYYDTQFNAYFRAVCSVWKGFRHLVINEFGILILLDSEINWDKREEKEINFKEFEKLVKEIEKQ
jgi:hypothetical protein